MKIKSIVAIILTGLLVVSMPMVAMAEETENHETHKGIDIDHGNTSFNNIVADGSETVCKTMGDVGSDTLSTIAISAANGAKVTAGSATNTSDDSFMPTVYARSKSTVTINGAVTNNGYANAIDVMDANVTAGSVTNGVAGQDSSSTVHANGLATVTIDGAVTNNGNEKAILADGCAKVTVGSATNNGAYPTVNANVSTVTINGDVTNNGNGSAIIVDSIPTATTKVTVFGEVNADTGIIFRNEYDTDQYEVNVYKINADAGKMLVDMNGKDVSNNVNVINSVHYIIKNSTPQYSFTVSGGSGTLGEVTDRDGVAYQTATAANDYKVTVATIDGYRFKKFAGDAASLLTDNRDGTYTLVVPTGGGVDLELVYEAIRRSNGGGNSTTTTPTTTNTGTGSWDIPATGAWTLNTDGTWSFGNKGIAKFTNTWGYILHTGSTTADWYRFGPDGKMLTGFQVIDGKTYYFRETKDNREGAMETGFQTINGKIYYFDEKRNSEGGAMATGWKTIGGKDYYFGADGALIQ